MKGHFEKWGWISFLTFVAEGGMFDVSGSGLNKIDNTKNAKLYDVLIWASEKKDHEETVSAYYEALNKKK